MPQRLEKEVAYLDANPNVGIVSGWAQYFGRKNRVFKTPRNDLDIKIMLSSDNYVLHTACMIRKSILDKYKNCNRYGKN